MDNTKFKMENATCGVDISALLVDGIEKWIDQLFPVSLIPATSHILMEDSKTGARFEIKKVQLND